MAGRAGTDCLLCFYQHGVTCPSLWAFLLVSEPFYAVLPPSISKPGHGIHRPAPILNFLQYFTTSPNQTQHKQDHLNKCNQTEGSNSRGVLHCTGVWCFSSELNAKGGAFLCIVVSGLTSLRNERTALTTAYAITTDHKKMSSSEKIRAI